MALLQTRIHVISVQVRARDRQVICVVEESDDLWAIERTNGYKGLYHVLGGVLSPLDGDWSRRTRNQHPLSTNSGTPLSMENRCGK